MSRGWEFFVLQFSHAPSNQAAYASLLARRRLVMMVYGALPQGEEAQRIRAGMAEL